MYLQTLHGFRASYTQYFELGSVNSDREAGSFIILLQTGQQVHLRVTGTLSGERQLSHYSSKGSTLKGKNLLPLGANSFLLQ